MKHGTRSAFVNQRCRCIPCTAANAAYMRRWWDQSRDERSGRLDPSKCGRRKQYLYYGCRCEKCRKAESDYGWRRRNQGTPEVLEQPRREPPKPKPKANASLPPGTRLDDRERAMLAELLR